jgi:TFIIF-interacting CTD phosphatase-like protein
MNEGMAQRKLLVLDLDETLLFATEEPLNVQEDFIVGPYHVYLRPHLKRFLRFCFSTFEVAVWTSSTADYAIEIARHILPSLSSLSFLWARNRCTRRFDYERGETYWVKDLKKVRRKGYDLKQVIVVDDTPSKLERSYGNLVRVREFKGEQDDVELLFLEQYLETLNSEANLRAVEKRNWKIRVELKEAETFLKE